MPQSTENEDGLDSVLLAVENPIRRKIIRRLSKERSYQLQISKELGFSQQLVAKHLEAMEGSGLVASLMEDSPHGPKRREYLLNKSISLSIDFAPNLFRARLFTFNSPELGRVQSAGMSSSERFVSLSDVLENPEQMAKTRPLGSLIAEIDKRLGNLEDERSVLLYIRHIAMREVAKAINGMPMTWDEKKLFFHLINENDQSVEKISKSLKLNQDWVREVILNLQKDA